MRSRHLKVVPPPAPSRAAVYGRVSSDQRAGRHTIDGQLSELKAMAARDGHDVRDGMLFVDDGHSGATLVRPALERLRDVVAPSAADVVHVHAPDRLARSCAHQVLLLEEFAGADARAVFPNRPIGGSPEDALPLRPQGMFAEYGRAKMLERSRRGKRHRAQAGAVSVLSRAPFGYRHVGRDAGGGEARHGVDEDAAGVVRRIFARAGRERLTLAGVCRRPLEAGIPSPTGRAHRSRAMVHTPLLNPAYVGRATFGRRRCVPWRAPPRPPRGHGGVPRRPWRQVPAPPETHIQVPVPAIVDEPLFAAAAERLEENRRRNRERLAGVRYPLRGLLVCEKCGYCFTGYDPGPRRHYRCSGTDRSKFHGQLRCDTRLLAVEPLEAAVWREVCRLLRDPARVLEEYQRRLDAPSAGPRRHELDAMQRQGGKLRGAVDRLIDGFAAGLIARHEFEPRIAQLRQRTARPEAEAQALRSAAEQARSLQLAIGKLSVFAEMVRDRLETADWDLRREVVRTLIKRIEVTDDVVRAVFRVEAGDSASSEPRPALRHCQAGRGDASHARRRKAVRRRARRRGRLRQGRRDRGFGRRGTSRPERGPVAGTMDQARPQEPKRRREDDRANADWQTCSSSDTIRWRPCADPGQKRDTGDRISAQGG